MGAIKQQIKAEKIKGITIRFELRTEKADKDGLVPVRLVFQIKGQRKVHNTGLIILPGAWDLKNQEAVYVDKKTARANYPTLNYESFFTETQAKEFNAKLSDLIRSIKEITDRFILDRVVFSADMVVAKLLAKHSPTVKVYAPTNQVFDFIDSYIRDNTASRVKGSLSVYKSLREHLRNFETKRKKKVVFDSIDYAFFVEFQNFLIGTKARGTESLGNVTIAKILSTFKTFLNYAKKNGLEVSPQVESFSIKKEKLEVIALTNEEFESVLKLDLTDNKALDQVRDVFCFSCATGLRYSDLAQLKPEHINFRSEEINMTVTKTKEGLQIPLNPISFAILEKYAGQPRPLPVISNVRMNEHVKILCAKAKIEELVQIVRFRGSKREENSYPKHKLITVHTARKTFATLSLEKGMSAEEVMKIGGWKTYASFARYVNITNKRSKVVMKKAWGEIRRPILKVV